jgi:hypothetical protein
MIIGAPLSIFYRQVGALTAAENQAPALKVANQLAYNNHGYSYNGEPAPSFYGYSGVGVTSGGALTKMEPNRYTMAIWVVPAGQATQKVTYVKASGEPEPEKASHELQSYFNAVPMPDVTKVPAERLTPAEGSDGFVCVWQPSTNRLWEIWRLAGAPSEYTFRFGGFREGVSSWNGIASESPNGEPVKWGAMATSLSMVGGLITIQDVAEALLGKPIKHALGAVVPNTAEGSGPMGPAIRTDSPEQNLVPELDKEGNPNPAYGMDAVNESRWFRFPPSAKAGEHGISKPLETAIFNAIRDYGLFVCNGGSAPNFFMEWPGVLGSPYAWTNVNPLAGAPSSWGTYSWIPSSMTSPSLPAITEANKGAGSIFSKQPWQLLEALEPRAS